MALHDYRRAIDIYGGSLITIEVTNTNRMSIQLIDEDRSSVELLLTAADAGILLDAIAGAIKTIEGIA